MVTSKAVERAINTLAILKFFPANAAPVGQLLADMCRNDEQVLWLARRTVQLYNEWPGPRELRAVLCSKFKPLDGIEACSGVGANGEPYFPEGIIPSEHQVEAKPMLALPEGHRFTADPEIETALCVAFARPAPKPKQIPPPFPPGAKLITEDDVFRAVEELNRKKLEAVNG